MSPKRPAVHVRAIVYAVLAAGESASALVSGDATRDNWPDLAVVNYSEDSFTLFRNRLARWIGRAPGPPRPATFR